MIVIIPIGIFYSGVYLKQQNSIFEVNGKFKKYCKNKIYGIKGKSKA